MRRRLYAAAISALAGLTVASAQVTSDCYRVEDVPTPARIAPEVTAVAFAPNGKEVASAGDRRVMIHGAPAPDGSSAEGIGSLKRWVSLRRSVRGAHR